MDSSFGDDIKNLAKQILKLKKGSSSQEFYDLSLELFEKAILFKNYNSFNEKNSLKKYMDDNNLSFINDRDINTFDNEKQTVAPLIETIKDMIPEMPETSISSTFIEADPEVISFERKESINIKKDDKIEQNVNDLFASEFKIDLKNSVYSLKFLHLVFLPFFIINLYNMITKVGYYKDEPQCVRFQKEHEALPQDGDWSSVEYHCRPKDSKSA